MTKQKLATGLTTGAGLLICAALLTACAQDDLGCTLIQAAAINHVPVHDTGFWDSDVTLPGVTTPVATHWTALWEGDPCSQAVPDSTHWAYQTVVTLTQADAAAVAHGWHWQPLGPTATPTPSPGTTDGWPDIAIPDELVPQLAGYVPAGVAWTESQDYEADLSPSQWYAVFLDPDRDVMLVFAFDR